MARISDDTASPRWWELQHARRGAPPVRHDDLHRPFGSADNSVMTYTNRYPVTVHPSPEGITIRGRTDANPRTGSEGNEFALLLSTHAEAILLSTHLRIAQDDGNDADQIGCLFVEGRLIGRPHVLARTHLAWSDTEPSEATALVVWSGEVYGEDDALGMSLDVAAVARLRADIDAAINEVPADAEFHAWDDQPGRVFDPSGGRDWVFADYVA